MYRGQVWHLLQDLASGKFLRLNESAYRVVSLMDGHRTLDEVWLRANELLGEEAPTQDELIQLVAQLHQANVLVSGQVPDLEELEHRRDTAQKSRFKQYFANPMALRFPLIDPDRLLGRLVGWMPSSMHTMMFVLWVVVVASGVMLAAMHWGALTGDLLRLAFTSEYVLMLIIVFPVLKALHELGHGLVIKMFGGQCREMGVMMLVLMPIPYVDATHASGFTSKYQRMLVGAAGMMTEVFIASIALWFWVEAEPGLFKVFLHEIILIAGVSTLIFNINPLLRLDGYYIFADWLEIPNLGQKSNQYFGYLLKRHLLRLRKHLNPPTLAKGEAPWLAGYAVLSFIYRMFIVVVIVLFVAGQLFFIGVLLALWSLYMMIVQPFFRTAKKTWNDPAVIEYRARLLSTTLGVLLAFGWLMFVHPMPSASNIEGVVWMPDNAHIRAQHPCFGRALLSRPGPVSKGQPLLECDDPILHATLEELRAKRQEYLADLARAEMFDQVLLMNIRDELVYVGDSIRDIESRISQFVIRSPHDGNFALPAAHDFVGRYWSRGEVIGYVLDPGRFSLMVAVPQRDADRVRNNTLTASVRPVGDVWRLEPARVVREVPAATRDLPSLALAVEGGGRFGLDPLGSSNGLPQSLEPLFLFELVLQDVDATPRVLGSRIYVRLEHDPEPIARQAYRVLRELLMKQFMV